MYSNRSFLSTVVLLAVALCTATAARAEDGSAVAAGSVFEQPRDMQDVFGRPIGDLLNPITYGSDSPAESVLEPAVFPPLCLVVRLASCRLVLPG